MLAIIRAQAECGLLGGGERSPREALEAVIQEVASLEIVVSGLLDLARSDSGLRFAKPVDLSKLVEEVGVDANVVAKEKGGTVLARVEPSLWVKGNKALLARVLWNLLSNAMVHGGEAVVLSLQRAGSELVVEIKDNGLGFEPNAEELFTPFARGRSNKAPGCGLGLALARALARQHSGDVAVKNPGQVGGHLVVTLPAARAPREQQDLVSQPQSASKWAELVPDVNASW